MRRVRWIQWLVGVGAGLAVLLALLLFALFRWLDLVPSAYPTAQRPMDPPTRGEYSRFRLDGFESPYLGHTGSWDGKGGAWGGGSKSADLDREVEMGLRWTFMPVHWSTLEPEGPVELSREVPPAWKALDAFVAEAERRGLNILMQAPVVGGNAGGPPRWVGRREPGKSAPENMEAAGAFAGKLAARYRPGGTLAVERGWGDRYGVRAWEIDNEPEMYRTHWKGQAGDYAEFATRVRDQIRRADPLAMVVLPGVASGDSKRAWLEGALDAPALLGSPAYRQRGIPHSIGPLADGVSFHVYEGLDSAFSGRPRTIEVVWEEVRDVFEHWENGCPGFEYPRVREYWHTEGNFDFVGALSEARRAAWRLQFLTRAFAAGVRKVCVMDAAPRERVAVKTYVSALPWPFPMERADSETRTTRGQAVAFRCRDGTGPGSGQVWILWAVAGSGDAVVDVPVQHRSVVLLNTDGTREVRDPVEGRIEVRLPGDEKMAPPILVVDRRDGGTGLP